MGRKVNAKAKGLGGLGGLGGLEGGGLGERGVGGDREDGDGNAKGKGKEVVGVMGVKGKERMGRKVSMMAALDPDAGEDAT